jgi:hypothetical protein
MGVKHIALAMVVIASLVPRGEPAMAVELGELQAVPGSHPPYIFRLAIVSAPREAFDLPAVTVRHPHDALSFVKNNRLEIRLRALTDVELEISQGGQTLNRLLPKSELQAARARLETVTGAVPHQPASAKGRDTAAAEAMPLAPTLPSAPDQALIEREMQALRQEIQNLVGRVTPWEELSTPAWHPEPGAAAPFLTLMLGGVVLAGVASLVAGYVMQRRALDRQRRRALMTALRRLRGELTAEAPTRAAGRRVRLVGDQPARLEPSALRRRVRVSQKIRRRIHLRALRAAHDQPRQPAAEPTQVMARSSQARPAAPAEVVEALGNLRRELLRLQRVLPTATPAERRHLIAGRASGRGLLGPSSDP